MAKHVFLIVNNKTRKDFVLYCAEEICGGHKHTAAEPALRKARFSCPCYVRAPLAIFGKVFFWPFLFLTILVTVPF